MMEILTELKRINCELVLVQPDKKSFLVKPKTNNEILNKKIGLNARRILNLLIDSDSLITSIEAWANDSNKWQQAHSKFIKNYQPVPYIQDAHDDLVSWLHANQRVTSAREKIHKLQGKKNYSDKEKVALNARRADVYAYQTISSSRRSRLITNLLLHSDLYGQIHGYMDKQNGKKKEAIASI